MIHNHVRALFLASRYGGQGVTSCTRDILADRQTDRQTLTTATHTGSHSQADQLSETVLCICVYADDCLGRFPSTTSPPCTDRRQHSKKVGLSDRSIHHSIYLSVCLSLSLSDCIGGGGCCSRLRRRMPGPRSHRSRPRVTLPAASFLLAD